MEKKKFELTENTKKAPNGETLYQIRALKNFTLINGKEVKSGDLGGWVNSENRLSQKGKCWIYENCMMYELSYRYDNSIGFGNSRQYGNSCQFGNSQQYGNSRQFGDSKQSGYTEDHRK